MPEKDPANYTIVTWLWMALLASWGGIVSYIQKVRAGETPAWRFTELVGEIIISAFAGVLTFLLCQASDFNMLLTAALVGVSGHMGSRGIRLIELWLKKRFES